MTEQSNVDRNESSIKVWDADKGELVPVDEIDYDYDYDDNDEYGFLSDFYDDEDDIDEYEQMSDEMLEEQYRNQEDIVRLNSAKDNFW